MKAISLLNETRQVQLIDVPEPEIERPNQLKLRILEIGICGTDREQVEAGYGEAPAGTDHLVIGHEMLGEVVEVGKEVKSFRKGDYAVLTVRRGCGQCAACQSNRSDMCMTGLFTERGIKGRHGFETEYVVDEQQYAVKVPAELVQVGVLTEPMSVVEKAIEEAVALQAARIPQAKAATWLIGKRTLVAGLGPIGLLAAIALLLRGAEVIGLDIVDEGSKRPDILRRLGGTYLDGRKVDTATLDARLGQVDFILEATGVAELGFQLIDALGVNGIYVMTGIPHGDRPVCITGAEMMQQIVLKNQLIMGSVNASTLHYAQAIEDMQKAKAKWGDLLNEIITTRLPFQQYREALDLRSENDIKTVLLWDKPSEQV
ncbi:glucose 1-dehydrogenase [Pontibacter roseus]|uniref:glucose 1-dehydrogenase n=1 Tax=Pontibacter roseus TaxID=336989 RepID=UPI00036F67DB|nr:glucose 1-dehydrogenase [Pontibacter roseus]